MSLKLKKLRNDECEIKNAGKVPALLYSTHRKIDPESC